MVLSSSNPSLDWIQQQTVGVRMRKSLPQRRDPAKSRLLLPELSNSCSKSGQAVAGPLAERMCTGELILQLPDI